MDSLKDVIEEVIASKEHRIKEHQAIAERAMKRARVHRDVAALDAEQRTRLIEKMALKFGIPPEEVANSLSSGIFPILDEHVTIAFCRTHSIILGV